MSEFAHGVGAFVALIGAALLIAILAERVRIPAAVAMVAVAAFVHIPPPFAFGDTLLFVFLPPLIFEAAWNLDLDALRRTAWRIALLAIPGTLATAAIVAAGAMLGGGFSFGAALLFGAIVAATDPVAVVAAFRRVRVPTDLRTLIEGESLFNDGVALILFGFALTIASGQPSTVGADILLGVVESVGGAAIGIIAGILCAGVLRVTDAAEYEVTVTIVLAYLSYVGATELHASGIFATIGGAIALRAMLRRAPHTITNAEDVDRVWNALAFVANAAVFTATGLVIEPSRILHEPGLVAGAIVAVLVARIALAVLATRSPASRATMFLAGMRGALPLALALSLPDTLSFRPQIIDATFAVVLFTIVVQGAPLEIILARFYGDARGTPA
jgi:monovalent cation:H+ antiporter, CPA1 family